jgi:CBS domain-containing protein
MAILFVIAGFLYNPFLIFIGIFVYLGAQAEAGLVEMQSALEGLRVRDAMMTRFRTLATHDPLTKAVQELLAGSQQDFPVIENDQPVGMLRRNDLVKALAEGRSEAVVTEAMCRDCETVDEAAPLKGVGRGVSRRRDDRRVERRDASTYRVGDHRGACRRLQPLPGPHRHPHPDNARTAGARTHLAPFRAAMARPPRHGRHGRRSLVCDPERHSARGPARLRGACGDGAPGARG